jgi:activating signal cointegrator 1
MKALSIRHPWVDLILAGTKTIEIRTWATRYRGPILLHASGAYGISEREAAARLRLPPPEPERMSAIVGIAELVDCRPVRREDWKNAGLPPLEGKLWAWVFAGAHPIGPVFHAGNRTLFEIDDAEVMSPAT